MYAFNTDLRTGVIEIVIAGFWQDGEVEAFAAGLAKEVASVHETGRMHATLYDYTDAVIQSQETVARFADIARDNPFRVAKTAIFTGGKLARRQAGRIAEQGPHIRVFEDRDEALAWLRA